MRKGLGKHLEVLVPGGMEQKRKHKTKNAILMIHGSKVCSLGKEVLYLEVEKKKKE